MITIPMKAKSVINLIYTTIYNISNIIMIIHVGRAGVITRLPSKTEQPNIGLPEVVQFGMHLFGSCHPFQRTEAKQTME